MTPFDAKRMSEVYPLWRAKCGVEDGRPARIAVLSPSEAELAIMRRCFPGSRIIGLTERDWTLPGPAPDRYDVIEMANVLMYSPQPEAWLDSLLSSCRELWMEEPVWRKRADGELGSDGDSCRLSFPPLFEARAGGFDVRKRLGERCVEWDMFEHPTEPGGSVTWHALVRCRGKL
jgi:hypothetical protein